MTQKDAIEHWRKGAREALQWAVRMYQEKSNALAMFHCHLAVEKALKAKYMEDKKEPAPYTHSLTHLASLVDAEWTEEDVEGFQELSPFSSQARYDDVGWVEEQATPELVERWVERSHEFLSRLHCDDER